MSRENHYRSNLRDIRFNLFEFLDVGNTTLGKGPFQSMTQETAQAALEQFEKVAMNELAPSFAVTDKAPPVRQADGQVTVPEPLKKALRAYFDGEWHKFDLPEHLGGFGAPPSVAWCLFEMLAGAHGSLAFYPFGTILSKVIDKVASPSQKARFVPRITDRQWGGAMVLTEADAGSDVGAGRTKAKQLEGDVWEISGVKRFITNGDFDAVENIVHLVLARPEGAGPGTKGLSMFIVPKIWVNEDGSLGGPNGVYCSNLEKKMGLKGSATCEMTYGDVGQCRGFLVGDKHDGIRQMFQVIEQARMAVGVKSMSTLSTAYLNSLDYAKERVQGGDMSRMMEKDSPRVRIIAHPDVRQMLMAQKAHAEGLRALALFTAWIQDQVDIEGGHGAGSAKSLDKLNDLLLPLVKGYASEKVADLLRVSLQVFGGSGFLQDYPIEQYMRDQKIDSLYEGTTHIQAQDLLFRKIARDGGETLQGLLGRIRKTVEEQEGGVALAEERRILQTGMSELEGALNALMEKMGESVYHVGLQGNRLLFAVAEVVIGWLLIRHAAVAVGKLGTSTGEEKAFYEGKIASARWFARNVLTQIVRVREQVQQSELSLMELSEEAF